MSARDYACSVACASARTDPERPQPEGEPAMNTPVPPEPEPSLLARLSRKDPEAWAKIRAIVLERDAADCVICGQPIAKARDNSDATEGP